MKIRVYLRSRYIRVVLLQRGMSHREFADKIGTGEWYLSRLLVGKKRVGLVMQKRILRAIGRDHVWDNVFRMREETGASV